MQRQGIKTRQFNNKMTALINKPNIMTLLTTSGMGELWFGCFEYYHTEVVIHSMNAYVWCWSEIYGSLDEIPSVTMGSCKSKILNEF